MTVNFDEVVKLAELTSDPLIAAAAITTTVW